MENLLLWLAVFLAGIAGGAFGSSVVSRVKNRRRELVVARTRILAGVKEWHEQEILRQLLPAIDTINNEMNKSFGRLAPALEKLLIHIRDDKVRKQGPRKELPDRVVVGPTLAALSMVCGENEKRSE